MISLAYTPTIQSVIDRWRMQLPVPVQVDETLMTKEHLRLLITMLIEVVDQLHAQLSTNSNQRSDSVIGQPSSQPDLRAHDLRLLISDPSEDKP